MVMRYHSLEEVLPDQQFLATSASNFMCLNVLSMRSSLDIRYNLYKSTKICMFSCIMVTLCILVSIIYVDNGTS